MPSFAPVGLKVSLPGQASGSAVARVSLGTPAPAVPTIDGAPLTLGGLTTVLTAAAGSREEVRRTDADDDGTFEARFRYLAGGAYQLDLTGPAGVRPTISQARPAAVTVRSSFTVTGVSDTAPTTTP